MASDPHWDRAGRCSHTSRAGARKPCASAATLLQHDSDTLIVGQGRARAGACSRRARAGWRRCHAWVGSITNTSGEQREPITNKWKAHLARTRIRRVSGLGYRADRPAATSAIVGRPGPGRLPWVLTRRRRIPVKQSLGWSHGDCRVRSPRPDLASCRPGPLLPVRHQRFALRSSVGPHAPSVVRRYGPRREHGPRVVHGRTCDGQFLDREVYRSPAACPRRVRGSRGGDWPERDLVPGGPAGSNAPLRLAAPIAVVVVLALQSRALFPRLRSSLRAHRFDGGDLAGVAPFFGEALRP